MSWYYCNLIDDALREDPTSIGVQPLQSAVNVSTAEVKASLTLEQTALGAAGANELDVAKALFVLAANAGVSNAVEPSVEQTSDDVEPTEQPAVVQAIELPKVEEPVSVEVVVDVPTAHAAPEVQTDKVEQTPVDVVEDAPVEPVPVEPVAEEPVVVEPVVVEPVPEVQAEQAEEEVVDAAPTAADVETAAIDIDTPAVAPVEETTTQVAETSAVEETPSILKSADEPAVKLESAVEEEEVTKRVERMPSIPEEDEVVADAAVEQKSLTEESAKIDTDIVDSVADAPTEPLPVEEVDATTEEDEAAPSIDEEAAADDKLPAAESSEAEADVAKPVADDESETQSEISEITAIEAVDPVAKTAEEPESEIDEVMTIDAVAAAKDAALTEAAASKFTQSKEATSFGFIPEQIRRNSYAVSSVAVAVATAVVATLVARR